MTTIKGVKSWQHDPARRGIFVQRQYDSFMRPKGFCVTFPRLGNLNQAWEQEVLFPSGEHKTFVKSYAFASQVREMDSRLRGCRIFLCEMTQRAGNKSVWERELQEVG